MTIAIAGPLIIAPQLMQWEAFSHKFPAKKHRRFKTPAPDRHRFGRFYGKEIPKQKTGSATRDISFAWETRLNGDFRQDVHAPNLCRQAEF